MSDNVIISDLRSGLPVYVQIDEASKSTKLIDITTLSSFGYDCPCCGNTDCIEGTDKGFICQDCSVTWWKLESPE